MNTVPNTQQTLHTFWSLLFSPRTPGKNSNFQWTFVKQVVCGRIARYLCDVENKIDQNYNKGTLLTLPVLSHSYFIKANSLYLQRSKYCHLTRQTQNLRHNNSYRSPKGSSQVHQWTTKIYETRKDYKMHTFSPGEHVYACMYTRQKKGPVNYQGIYPSCWDSP